MSRGVVTPGPHRSATTEPASAARPKRLAQPEPPAPELPAAGRELPPTTRERMEASFGGGASPGDPAPASWTTQGRIVAHARAAQPHAVAATAHAPRTPRRGPVIQRASRPPRRGNPGHGGPGAAPPAPSRPSPHHAVQTGPAGPASGPSRHVEAQARGPPEPGRSPIIQTKLSVSSPGEPLEREADAVAARASRRATPRPPSSAGAPLGRLQRAAASPRGPSVMYARGPPTAPGQALDTSVRTRIEPHVGLDLSNVVVRHDPEASAAAEALHARAFTSGSTIFLGARGSPTDVALMAHEATHVAQQQSSPAARTMLMRQAEDSFLPDISLPDISVGDFIPDWVLDGVREAVRSIPGYTLLTQITGVDPLTDAAVEVSREELVEALLTYGPFGAAVGPVLQAVDVLGEVFDFISEGLAANDLTLARLRRDIAAAWDEFSVANRIDGNVAIVERYVDRLLRDVRSFVSSIVDRVLEIVRAAAAEVLEPLLETPEIKPVWDLTKKVLHYDPLRGEAVEAPTIDILADFLRLIGQEDRLAQMQERGTLQETAGWLDEQLATFASLVDELGALFNDAWAAIRPENLPDLLTNLESLAGRAFGFVQRVGEFAATVIVKVLELVKHALLGWLSEHAHSIPGFHLLTVILERNPFTGETVPRTAENLIKGFITLLPGGERMYEQLAEAGVIASAAERIETEMTRLGISWELITGTFLGVWETLTLDDLLDPIGAFGRVLSLFGEPLGRIVEFAAVVIEVVITLILRLMNFPSDLLGSIIANATQAIEDIQRDPVGFLMNMLEAVKLGFTGFFDNILTYLTQGLVDWLFRGLSQLGIRIPTDLSLASVLDLVLQVLGVTVELLWQKLGEHIGPERVEMIRSAIGMLSGAWSFIQDVQAGGVGAIWRYVTDQLGALWDTLLGMAKDWILETIVRNVTAKLLSLLDPTGVMAVVNSFIAFFRAVQSAIEYLREILEIVNQYVQTFAQIAAGNIVPGAQMLERGLANAIPIAIGFLAAQVGLGNVPEKIVEIIQQLRELIDQALDWLFEQAVRLGSAALSALGLGGDEAEPPEALQEDEVLRQGLEVGSESHTLVVKEPGVTPRLVIETTPQNFGVWLSAWRTDIAARAAATGATAEVDAAFAVIDGILSSAVTPTADIARPDMDAIVAKIGEISGLVGLDVEIRSVLAELPADQLPLLEASLRSLADATPVAAALALRAQEVEEQALAGLAAQGVSISSRVRNVAGVGLGLALRDDGTVRRMFALNDINLPATRAAAIPALQQLYDGIVAILTAQGFENVGGGAIRVLGAADVAAAQAVLPEITEREVAGATQRHEEDLIREALAGGADRITTAGVRVVVGVPQTTVCGRCVVRLTRSVPEPLPTGFVPGRASAEGAEHALISPITPDEESRMLVLGRALADALRGVP